MDKTKIRTSAIKGGNLKNYSYLINFKSVLEKSKLQQQRTMKNQNSRVLLPSFFRKVAPHLEIAFEIICECYLLLPIESLVSSASSSISRLVSIKATPFPFLLIHVFGSFLSAQSSPPCTKIANKCHFPKLQSSPDQQQRLLKNLWLRKDLNPRFSDSACLVFNISHPHNSVTLLRTNCLSWNL